MYLHYCILSNTILVGGLDWLRSETPKNVLVALLMNLLTVALRLS